MIEMLSASPVVFAIVIFLFALLIGSFLNVVIHRLPLMMQREWYEQCDELMAEERPELPDGNFSLVAPRSRCPNCGTMITSLQNIPVISYLVLRGKCGNCSTPISARYPAIELLTAIMAAVCAWRFGFGAEAIMATILTFTLIAISMIDYDTQLIPDSIVLPLLWLGLAMSLLHPLPGAETLFIAPSEAIIGAIAGYLSLWSVYQVFKLVTGKEGMGYGDFKLLAALGAWLGWEALPLIILMSALVGAVFGISLIVLRGRDRQLPIPFGPYLAMAGWITLLWGPQIVAWYMGLYH